MNPVVTYNKDLTDYAFQLAQDSQQLIEDATFIAPTVETGAISGSFQLFNDSNAFQALNARRGVGGKATRLLFAGDTGTYNAKPNALEIPIDEQYEAPADPAARTRLEQAKVKALLNSAYLSHFSSVMTVVAAAVSAMAGKGLWLNGNVDPIKEINDAILEIWEATGLMPNRIMLDLGAWATLVNHPKCASKMPGSQIAVPDAAGLARMLVNPSIKIRISTSTANTYGFDNASQTKTPVIGCRVWIFFASDAATVYDPSAAKVFSPTKELFTGVGSYQESNSRSTWYTMDWTADPQVVSTNCIRRLDVTRK